MKKLLTNGLIISAVFLYNLTAQAQTDKMTQDINAIKAMAGCYEVEFKYTETFAPEPDYEKAYDYTASGLEWATLIKDEHDHLSLQHILIVMDTMIVKHWRQDWIYENTAFHQYVDTRTWAYHEVPSDDVTGQWTQIVYQVDDSPRYSGSATWVHYDGKSYWENATDAPLPRREYTKRSDYNIMNRGNRQEITDYGWIHEQDNKKIHRTDTSETLIAEEKGYNVYRKVEDSRCLAAQDWWAAHHKEWSEVREVWESLYASKSDIILKDKVDNTLMYHHFFFHDEPLTVDHAEKVIDMYLVKAQP